MCTGHFCDFPSLMGCFPVVGHAEAPCTLPCSISFTHSAALGCVSVWRLVAGSPGDHTQPPPESSILESHDLHRPLALTQAGHGGDTGYFPSVCFVSPVTLPSCALQPVSSGSLPCQWLRYVSLRPNSWFFVTWPCHWSLVGSLSLALVVAPQNGAGVWICGVSAVRSWPWDTQCLCNSP